MTLLPTSVLTFFARICFFRQIGLPHSGVARRGQSFDQSRWKNQQKNTPKPTKMREKCKTNQIFVLNFQFYCVLGNPPGIFRTGFFTSSCSHPNGARTIRSRPLHSQRPRKLLLQPNFLAGDV